MKAVIILGDGMSDRPVAALGGKTPLMVAKKPCMDRIAREGVTGLFASIPTGMPEGSDVANLSVLGYDPRVCLQGRGVLEAASMGVALAPEDVAMRCNLICLDAEGRIKNHSAGHISSEEAAILIRDLDRELGGGQGDRPAVFHPGVSYRHLLVLPGGWASADFECAPPHDHVGTLESELLPKANGAEAESTVARLLDLHERAKAILAKHPVNLARVAKGKDPANAIWVWSPGHRPQMETMESLYGVKGAVISAVDLIFGIGVYAGLTRIDVEGATGLYDTNYEGKAQAALDALEDHDFVYVHVEATDEASHGCDLDLKIRCIEYLDDRLIRPIMEGLEAKGVQAAFAVLPDHPTPVETGTHANDPVPFAIWRPGTPADASQAYDEVQASQGSLGLLKRDQFIRAALGL
ncbi:cofactor-independent phosphoglycerate mutase [Holophaga foetida]|uniref:cofactor-independent phosphoglycerate mutase n=1 Tax=Holophaga foetida TaxID=35839 RepID=UPI000247264E|nr:cofactor-independent phosphoglycerate mutase [Holophaga foetida]